MPRVKQPVLSLPVPTCKNCKFYRPPKSAPGTAYRVAGICRRYPEPVSKDIDDWCGEYRP